MGFILEHEIYFSGIWITTKSPKMSRKCQSFCSLKILKSSWNKYVQLLDWLLSLKEKSQMFHLEKLKLRSFWIKLLRIGHCATALTAVNVPCYYLWSTCHQWTFFSTTFYLRKASKYLVFESSPTFLYHNTYSSQYHKPPLHFYIFEMCIDENSRIRTLNFKG